MNTVYVIKRDVDANGKPLSDTSASFWCGRNGGGWSGWGATGYATMKLAQAAIKRNAKSEWTFRRGYAYIVEVDPSICGAH